MVLDPLAKLIWSRKIKIIQQRLKDKGVQLDGSLSSLDDYLTRANEIALTYLRDNNESNSSCVSYSSSTYAAFLLLTEDNSKHDLEENVRCAGGFYVTEEAINTHRAFEEGTGHMWLEKKEGDSWKPFDTVPQMRSIPAQYATWSTIQITHKSKTITYDGLFNLFALVYDGLRK